jgi:hypothetical protein
MTNTVMFGVFSQKAADEHGSLIYRKSDGTEVEVTAICNDLKGFKSYCWKDKVFVGIVVAHVRQGRPNNGKEPKSYDLDEIVKKHWIP